MSSTIERPTWQRATRVVIVAAGLVAAWIGANAGIVFATERAGAVTAVFAQPPGRLALPETVAILEWDGRFGRFIGRSEGYVGDLYNAGALLVLPSRTSACLDLRGRSRTPLQARGAPGTGGPAD